MKPKELREMGEESLEEKLLELRTGLSKERGTISSGTKPENPGKIKQMRRDIARILTILNENQSMKTEKKQEKEMEKIFKKKLACGGTAKGTEIELQGEHQKKVKEILLQNGFKKELIDG